MATYNVAAGERGAYGKTLVAATADTVAFAERVPEVEIVSDGASAIFYTVDGTAPTVNGAGTYIIPAMACARQHVIRVPGATTIKLISSGTPVYSVAIAAATLAGGGGSGGGAAGAALDTTVQAVRDRLPSALSTGGYLKVQMEQAAAGSLALDTSVIGVRDRLPTALSTGGFLKVRMEQVAAGSLALDASVTAVRDRLPAALSTAGHLKVRLEQAAAGSLALDTSVTAVRDRLPAALSTDGYLLTRVQEVAGGAVGQLPAALTAAGNLRVGIQEGVLGFTVADPVGATGNNIPIQYARVNADSTANSTVVTLTTNKSIRVLGYAVIAGGAGTITIKGGTSVLAELPVAANGGVSYAGGLDAPAFQTAEDKALIFQVSTGADSVNGHLCYVKI